MVLLKAFGRIVETAEKPLFTRNPLSKQPNLLRRTFYIMKLRLILRDN
nr:MAG TPA: hypothetical protein [Bacteriophage sp.]